MSLPAEATVESIRTEFRGMLFDLCFNLKMHQIGNTQEATIGANVLENLLAFGLNSRLIVDEERNDWLEAAQGKQVLARVAHKWKAI